MTTDETPKRFARSPRYPMPRISVADLSVGMMVGLEHPELAIRFLAITRGDHRQVTYEKVVDWAEKKVARFT